MNLRERDEVYARGHTIGLLICVAWPVALVGFMPWILKDMLLGGAILVASVTQIFWVPDRIGRWLIRHF